MYTLEYRRRTARTLGVLRISNASISVLIAAATCAGDFPPLVRFTIPASNRPYPTST